MKKLNWKMAVSLMVILTAGTLFAGCETSETVTVAAGPGGSAVILEECDSAVGNPECQNAKKAMHPAAETCKKDDKKAEKKDVKTVEVSRKHHSPLAEFEAEATKLASTLAHAFKNGDAKAFVAALPEAMRKDFDEKKFMEAHKLMTDAMGEIVSADFLTDLKHPLLSIRLWKIGFKKISKDAGEITQQAIFQVSIGEVDKKAQVVSFGFI